MTIGNVTVWLNKPINGALQMISADCESLHCPRRGAVDMICAARIFVTEKADYVAFHPSLETIDHLCRITASQE
jgi:hypothetical protein